MPRKPRPHLDALGEAIGSLQERAHSPGGAPASAAELESILAEFEAAARRTTQRIAALEREGAAARRELDRLQQALEHAESRRAKLERMQQVEHRETSRARELQQALSEVRAALVGVQQDLERIGDSRAWRYGHAVTRAARRVTGRPVRTDGAVAAALRRVKRVRGLTAGGTPVVAPAPSRSSPRDRRAAADQLGCVVRERLGPVPKLDRYPLVSIIVVTHNGRADLESLIDGLKHRTHYPAFELVIVDNASDDGTRELLADSTTTFPLRVLHNDINSAFAAANNQAAAVATGELLLLLNNDVDPVEPGWLTEMVHALGESERSAVSALLLHGSAVPDDLLAWPIQHSGILFRAEDGLPRAYNDGEGTTVFGPAFGVERPAPAGTAACLLVDRAAFEAAGGLHEMYRWGTEDVDLGLQLTASGGPAHVCTGRAVLLHTESSTQQRHTSDLLRDYRTGNDRVLQERHGPWLRRRYRQARLSGDAGWTDGTRSHVAITVTSNDPRKGWGDWYTAHEMGDALVDLGWRVTYVQRERNEWCELPDDIDYVLILMDTFDARNVPPGVVTIAWIRNWTERWLTRPWFDRLDVLLASSRRTAELIQEATGRSASLFPLATNPTRFAAPVDPRDTTARFDYIFTGNHWGQDRDLQSALAPRGDERFAIFGSGWDGVRSLSCYAQGPIDYEALPAVYRGSKIVLDDTAGPTLPYEAVNSRVFDALAAGTPVITNGAAGAKELFDDDFPSWNSAETLRTQIDALLGDEAERIAIARRYQEQVLSRHTYGHRARRLSEILVETEDRLSFCIKIGAPDWEAAPRWGDLHFARAIAREFQRRGHRCLIQVLSEWDDAVGHTYDVAIVLRGLSRYTPRPGQFNVLWSISHPDGLTENECDAYDLVCVASRDFADKLAKVSRTQVAVLEQATDPRVFRPDPDPHHQRDAAYVANSRGVLRRIMAELLPTDYDLAVYGSNWSGLIPERYIVAEYVPNEDVRKIYSSASVVLNDHWDDMREHGFISNRIYDALACGAVVVSDRVAGLERRFGGAVVTYDTPQELRESLDRLLADPEERRWRAKIGHQAVLASHTFAHRVDVLLGLVGQGGNRRSADLHEVERGQ